MEIAPLSDNEGRIIGGRFSIGPVGFMAIMETEGLVVGAPLASLRPRHLQFLTTHGDVYADIELSWAEGLSTSPGHLWTEEGYPA